MPHPSPQIRVPGAVTVALALVTAALGGTAALAAEPVDPRVELSVGFYEPSFDSSIRLDSGALGIGTGLDLERDLGLDSSGQEWRAGVGFRLGERFRLDAEYVAFDREGSATLNREVQFGDVVYAANAQLTSRVESSHADFSLRWAFVKTPTTELALSLGGSYLDFSAGISGVAKATANGIPLGSTTIAEKTEASAPVPLVGLHAAFEPSDTVRVRLMGRWFDIDTFLSDYQGWTGTMTEYGVDVDWFVLPWLAVSGGYAGTRIDAEFDDGDNIGAVKYDFDGFRVGTIFAF